MTIINRLARVAFGIHFADQIALVSVPLTAVLVFDATADVIGVLVACQSLAHLIGALPFGILVDRSQQRALVLTATLISFIGFLGVTVSIHASNIWAFGATVTIAGFAVVLFTLSALSIVPKVADTNSLARANATIELPRTFVSFLVPLGVAILITQVAVSWFFIAAAAGAALSFIIALRLPNFEKSTTVNRSFLRRLKVGGVFVLKNQLLRAISLCAIFWNLAFTALLVVMVPLLSDYYLLDPGIFGFALSAFGLAAIAGTWAARQFGGKIPPNVLLVFGPAASVVAAVLLYFVSPNDSVHMIYLAFFLLGFGPAMWLITQNSVRQLITPANMLGSVNAFIQTAIYGMRPLGALLGGTIASATTLQNGLFVVIVGFLLSFLVAAFSPLNSIKRYSDIHQL